MNLKDRRVDRMLSRAGFDTPTVFYSPVGVWFLLFALLLPTTFMVIELCRFGWGRYLLPAIAAYLACSYFLFAKECYSIALAEDGICFVNPNQPFPDLRIFGRENITGIRIGSERARSWKRLFLIGANNFVVIELGTASFRFGCAGLEADAFDENFTEKTLDDLHNSLKAAGYPVIWTLDEPPL